MIRKVFEAIMPIAVGIWIGIGISNWPKIAAYLNIIVMIVIFICASFFSWYFTKEKHNKDKNI